MNTLENIVAQRPAVTVANVLQMLTDIDQLLADTDGLKSFNHLYLAVTTAVRDAIATSTFNDASWISQLDVLFANLYFDALGMGAVDVSAAPAAWQPLLAARQDPGIARIQFALAGMNAHINRDLPVAIVQIYQANGGTPDRGDPHYADYDKVNGILETVETQVKQEFTTGIFGVIDATAGPLDDVLAMWDIRAARNAAWTHAELLWNLRDLPALRNDFLATLDDFTGFAGRGLLTHVTSGRSL
jgi:hypothetical protein